MAYKVFTNGSVLQASEINDNLMRQSVMVFSNAAARTAAITSPVEGMLTWLEDVNRYESYNGSSWGSPFGMTQLINSTITGVSTFAVDNVFTSSFENYQVVLKVDSTTGGNSIQMTAQYRKAGATVSAANYRHGTFFTGIDGGTTGVFNRGNGVSSIVLGSTGVPSVPSFFRLDVLSPNISTTTTGMLMQSMIQYGAATPATSSNMAIYGSSNYTANDNFDGIIINAGSGNFSGNIKIYGYRN